MKIKFLAKTKRLMLRPLSDEEIDELIGSETDPEMIKAYGEMKAGAVSDPANRNWYAPWTIVLKGSGIPVGDLCFKGPATEGAVEIGYGIYSDYQGQGFATEACKAALDWAFEQEGVLFVEAEAEESNAASLRVIEKLGMKKYGQGEEGPRFYVKKPGGSHTSIGLCLGLCLGVALGDIVFGNISIGLCTGMSLGICVGALLDNKEKKGLAAAEKVRYGGSEGDAT